MTSEEIPRYAAFTDMFVYEYADVLVYSHALLPYLGIPDFCTTGSTRQISSGEGTRQISSGEDESTTVGLAGAPFVVCGISRPIRGATGRRGHCVHVRSELEPLRSDRRLLCGDRWLRLLYL